MPQNMYNYLFMSNMKKLTEGGGGEGGEGGGGEGEGGGVIATLSQ